MANTKYILEKIKLEGELKELLVKTDGENTAVTYNGTEMTLAAALAAIYASLTSLPTDSGIDSKISAAIDRLIGGAPETYDTLKEIADYIAEHQDVADALSAAVGNKVDKVEGMGLSANDFTDELKAKLDGLRGVRYGAEPPQDMQDGELFVRVVSGA